MVVIAGLAVVEEVALGAVEAEALVVAEVVLATSQMATVLPTVLLPALEAHEKVAMAAVAVEGLAAATFPSTDDLIRLALSIRIRARRQQVINQCPAELPMRAKDL